LRAEHVAVDHKRLLIAEQIGKPDIAAFAFEQVILTYLAARRLASAHFGHSLDMTAKLDLLGEQRLAGAPIFRAFIGITNLAGARQLGGGFQGGTGHGITSVLRI
jgi:hypothetical protein